MRSWGRWAAQLQQLCNAYPLAADAHVDLSAVLGLSQSITAVAAGLPAVLRAACIPPAATTPANCSSIVPLLSCYPCMVSRSPLHTISAAADSASHANLQTQACCRCSPLQLLSRLLPALVGKLSTQQAAVRAKVRGDRRAKWTGLLLLSRFEHHNCTRVSCRLGGFPCAA